MHKGINFQRAEETLDVGIKSTQQVNEAMGDSTLVQQTKEKVMEIISKYNKIYTSSSLWAVKQTKLMQELRQNMAVEQPKSDEPEMSSNMNLR